MPYSSKNPPNVAKNWTPDEQHKCIVAANSVISKGGSHKDAIFACINAAGKSKKHTQEVANHTLVAEVFAEGKWNNQVFTSADLDSIVENFFKLKDILTPSIKLGHNDEQPLKDGELSLGEVDDIWREGSKLMAKFINLPSVVYNAIKKKRFKKVSVELLPNVTHKGEHYKYLLSAVALLGAELPAVNTIADLDKFIASDQFDFTDAVCFTAISNEKRTNTMPISEEEALEFKRRAEEAEQREKNRIDEDRKNKIAFNRKTINVKLEEAVTNKQLTPAQRDNFTMIIGIDDDDAMEKIDVSKVDSFIASSKPAKQDGEQGRQDGGDDDDDLEGVNEQNISEVLDKKIRKYMLDKGEDNYEVAMMKVMHAEPKLAEIYKFSNGFIGRAS